MRTLLVALALALTTVHVSHAEVLVYQGTGKTNLPNIVGKLSKKPHLYYVEYIGDGKRVGRFSFVFNDGGLASFGVGMFYFRGKEIALAISSSAMGNYPKTLVGLYRSASRHVGVSYNGEINFSLSFDAFHTQLANNIFKTAEDAYVDLQSELTVKGYQ